jgi:hypothetical protein
MSQAQLWDQSQLINLPMGGTGGIAGQHLSSLETGQTLFGAGAQGPPTNNICADDFTLSTTSTITGFSVFSYVTGATAPNVTGVNWAIGNAASTTLTTTNVASTFWSVGGLGVYRVAPPDTSGNLRRLQITTVTGLNLVLGPGTYFLSFSVNPGNFTPVLPISTRTHGANMLQSIAAGAFAPLVDGTAGGADMAFIIDGQAVPEPASMIALGAGIAALVARRRRK